MEPRREIKELAKAVHDLGMKFILWYAVLSVEEKNGQHQHLAMKLFKIASVLPNRYQN